MRSRPFRQVDVFTSVPYRGNPVAVVLDGDGLDDEEMAAFARWTNLSETTFVLPPSGPGAAGAGVGAAGVGAVGADAAGAGADRAGAGADAAGAGPAARAADYRLRIFTPSGELPFAGHPTLGSCHAWLGAGGTPEDADRIVQECAAGLVELRRDGARLAFAAPPRRRTGPLDDELLGRVCAGLGLGRDEVVAHAWVDNGPGWCAVLLGSAERVLEVQADFRVLGGAKVGLVAGQTVGVVGPRRAGDQDGRPGEGGPAGSPRGAGSADRPRDAAAAGPSGDGTAFEVRAFFPDAPGPDGVVTTGSEDPVTGSLNASVAQWLREEGRAPASYVAAQGTAIGRAGRIHVDDDGERIWVGGDCTTCVSGVVAL
jgi:predicted PhzF superfamily epimerase YddE/YHI9